MKIFDAHCDVLMKLFNDPSLDFKDGPGLQVTYKALRETGSKIQCFAIYVPERVYPEMRFFAALSMVELFHEKILSQPNIVHIKTKRDIEQLKESEIGAILTLEGCDCIGGDILKLKTLLRLGVKSVGLTWNHANLTADGALESRGAGVSDFGRKVINILNEQSICCDVSHLSEKAFWDVMETADHPFASHSNVYNLQQHPRNLRDDQIKALLNQGGVIGITFVPEFLTENATANISDVIKHVDYICSMGGERQLGFGSDFDGIERTVRNLSAFGDYYFLINELLNHFPDKIVKGLLYDNINNHFLGVETVEKETDQQM